MYPTTRRIGRRGAKVPLYDECSDVASPPRNHSITTRHRVMITFSSTVEPKHLKMEEQNRKRKEDSATYCFELIGCLPSFVECDDS